MSNRVVDVIRGMAESADWQKVLDEMGLTAGRAMGMLRGRVGRRELQARRELARIHSELVALRFGPFSVHKLTQLLNEEKPEFRLKGALSLLAMTRLDGKGVKKRQGKLAVKEEGVGIDSQEARDYLEAVAEVMVRKRAAAKAGRPEKICLTGGGK